MPTVTNTWDLSACCCGIATDCCEGVPEALTLTVTGDCSCLNGTYALAYNGFGVWVSAPFTPTGCGVSSPGCTDSVYWSMACVDVGAGPVWIISLFCEANPGTNFLVPNPFQLSGTCDPFDLTASGTVGAQIPSCSGDAVTIGVTE